MKQKERLEFLKKELPHKRFGKFITEKEVKTRHKELRREAFRAKTGKEKRDIRKKMRFLRDVTKIKRF